MYSTPQRVHLSHFGSFSALRNLPEFWANKPITRCLDRRAKCQSGTLVGATGGTQTHSRRTGSKLGQLLCARQGLVRVSESNTKYGGKRRKTGVTWRPLCRQVSVSPQGFPSEKIVSGGVDLDCARCSQGRYFLRPWACPWETHVRLRSGPGWYPRQPVV